MLRHLGRFESREVGMRVEIIDDREEEKNLERPSISHSMRVFD